MKYKATKISANDDQLKVIKIYYKNGDFVYKNDIIMELESTKAAIEITALEDNPVYFFVDVEQEIVVGDLIAEQSKTKIEIKKTYVEEKVITKAAKKIIDQSQISIENFNMSVIKLKDVEDFLEIQKNKDNQNIKITNQKYPLLNQYKFIPTAILSFEYPPMKIDKEEEFWDRLYKTNIDNLFNEKSICNFIYNGETLHLFPIAKLNSDVNITYREELDNASMEIFRGNFKNAQPKICVSYLKSELKFNHVPLLYKDSIITIGVTDIKNSDSISVSCVYDHRYTDGFSILKIFERF